MSGVYYSKIASSFKKLFDETNYLKLLAKGFKKSKNNNPWSRDYILKKQNDLNSYVTHILNECGLRRGPKSQPVMSCGDQQNT